MFKLNLPQITPQVKNNKKAFTLLEVLLVVAAIGILAGIVILAINPGKNIGDTRDTQRKADVNTIISGVYQYSIDNGSIPSTITTTSTEICQTGASSCTGYIDLSVLTASETYLTEIPQDPEDADATGTGYFILRTANDRVTISAPDAENGTISITR